MVEIDYELSPEALVYQQTMAESYERLGWDREGRFVSDDPNEQAVANSADAQISDVRPPRVQPTGFSAPARRLPVTEALTLILGTFAPGESLPYEEVMETLDLFGLRFSIRTLHKARKRAGIEVRRVQQGRNGFWQWYRPLY